MSNTKQYLSFDENKFKNPQKEYRGLPFWAWNTFITEEKVEKQIKDFKAMGLGGFVIHVRHGLMDEYMGKDFFDRVFNSIEEAKKHELLVWLYDEDRWPSGCAGGMVTKNRKYAQKYLTITKNKITSFPRNEAIRDGKPYLLAAYDVTLTPDGFLENCRVTDEENANLFAYVETAEGKPRYNGQAYVDTMNDEAIAEFIRSTYDVYFEKCGKDFGNTIEAIFTDEPQVARFEPLAFTDIERFTVAHFSWSDDFPSTYEKAFGESIIDRLPELVFERADGELSSTRYRYNEHVAARFRKAYTKQIGDWCRAHGIAFTGHCLWEEGLQTQSKSTRDVMRTYPDFDIPGMDVLRGNFEYTTAKQCQSVARQSGKTRVMSELYGVTNWDADFRDYIHQGNWQAAMGITARVHHLTWMSMLGVGKRDYPATFGYQAPWYLEFPKVEDHFARLNTMLTSGEPVVKIGVIHPVESFWFFCGSEDKTADIRKARDDAFHSLCEWLIFDGYDFDYINESLIPEQYANGSVGEMKYDAVIVPDCITLRSSTLDMLKDMKKRGVQIIFAGGLPSHIDGIENNTAEEFALDCDCIPYTREAISVELAPYATFELFRGNGQRADNYIHQERIIDGDRWFFITPAKTIECKEDTTLDRMTLRVDGNYIPTLYNTMNGDISTPKYIYSCGDTAVTLDANSYDSFLIRFEKGKKEFEAEKEKPVKKTPLRIPHKAKYTREEPNVLLLDMAEYSHDGVNFEAEEEILRIDTVCRKLYSLPSIMGKAAAQPWSVTDDPEHELWLRFCFDSDIESDVSLAFERLCEIRFNGQNIDTTPTGSYVDMDIYTVKLPKTKIGKNELLVKILVGKKYGAEPMYILGDFNVSLCGTDKTLLLPTSIIGYGDITSQGLPFYSGNLVYEHEIDSPDCDLEIAVTSYRGDLLTISLDGEEKGAVILPPYRVKINNVSAGKHTLRIRYFGNRHNTFGSLHCCITDTYYGPNHWYKEGDHFTYEYTLRKTGVLRAPKITVIEK